MIDKVLEERGSRYGAFKDHAFISQSLQEVLWKTENWHKMPLDSRQALIVICDKIARMLNGDPEYDDNWVDIIGYATLVLNRIREANRAQSVESKNDSLKTYQDSRNEVFQIPTPDYAFPGITDTPKQ